MGRPSFSPVSGEPGGGVLTCFFVVHLSPYWPYWWPGSGNEKFPKRRHFLSYMLN